MKDQLDKKPTWKVILKDICGELTIHLTVLVLCLLMGNVYAAYIFFGFGALFLILPFGMIFYYLIKKIVLNFV